ncbi:hypothetical protein EVA_06080 [gut metagenome]|uniref:Uncharacterized protein n=1 Tax=gut metagenome TaxID=749906 RepID=J9CZU5_9ZZZZ
MSKSSNSFFARKSFTTSSPSMNSPIYSSFCFQRYTGMSLPFDTIEFIRIFLSSSLPVSAFCRAGLPYFCLAASTSFSKPVLSILVSQAIDINLPCALVIKFSFPKSVSQKVAFLVARLSILI